MAELHHPDIGRERTDFNPRVVAVVLATVAALILVTVGALWLFADYLDRRERTAKGHSPPLIAAEREAEAGVSNREALRRHVDGRPILEGLPPEDPTHRVGPWHGGTAQRQVRDDQAWLDSCGWVDRERGLVRVPLERAVKMALADRAKHLPSRPAQEKP